MDAKKILSVVALVLSVIFFVGYIVTYRESLIDSEHPSKKARNFVFASVLFLMIGTGLAASYKSGDSKLEKQDYINIVIVLLAILLIVMAYFKKWGIFPILIGNTIAALSATTMIVLD